MTSTTRLGRTVWVALALWGLAWALVLARHGGVSWHYFHQGGLALIDLDDPTGSVHVYATHPDLQFGPAAMLAATVLSMLGPSWGMLTAQVLGAGAGLAVLALLADTAAHLRPLGTARQRTLMLAGAGAAFLPVWMNLAVRFVHIDDVLALLFVTTATALAVRRHPVAAGVLVGLSVAAKPWALPFAVLLVALPTQRARASIAAAGTAALCWLPFVLADPASLVAARFHIPTSPASSLHTLGLATPTTPAWDRPVQLALGTAVALVAVRRRRWAAVVLLVLGVRVLLDPGAYSYYSAGVVLGALCWDLLGSPARLPWWTWGATVSTFLVRWTPLAPLGLAWVRTGFVALCVALLVMPPARRRLVGQRTILRVTEPTEALVDA
jgi:hypothetical protein